MTTVPLGVPQQTNQYDCGIFLAENIENILRKGPESFRKAVKTGGLLDWIQSEGASAKRKKLIRAVEELAVAQGQGKTIRDEDPERHDDDAEMKAQNEDDQNENEEEALSEGVEEKLVTVKRILETKKGEED